jgi:hypothetical protein
MLRRIEAQAALDLAGEQAAGGSTSRSIVGPASGAIPKRADAIARQGVFRIAR